MIPTGGPRPPAATRPPVWLEALLEAHPPGASDRQRAFLTEGGPGSLVLFGAGYQGELTLSDLRAMGLDGSVRCFLDNEASKWGRTLGGLPICAPNLLDTLPKDTRILITSGAYAPIRSQLAEAGFSSGVRILDLSALRNGLFDRDLLVRAAPTLERLHAMLGDAFSRKVLEGVIAYRLTADITHVEAVCEPLQYFPDGVVKLGPKEVFIDGGAFDGDTVRTFLAACGGAFETIHAFEPDPRNAARLRDWIAGHPDRARIHAHAEALYSHPTELRFEEGPSMSSRIDAVGGTCIQATSLDACLQGAPATFIKFDLEGAERAALKGAEATIRTWRPKLAISAYHLADDLWELPAMIAELTPGYRYFLRHYSFLSFETVFYAIPEEQCP